MLKRFTAIFLSALLLCVSVGAENYLGNYQDLLWNGDPLTYDERTETIYFTRSEKTEQSASFEVKIDSSHTGFYFYVDSGNGANNSDVGECVLAFKNDEGEEIFSVSTGEISGLDYYSRFSVGDESEYYPLPDNAASAEITLYSRQNSSMSRVNAYFRNLVFVTDANVKLSLPAALDKMTERTGLSKVEVGTSGAVKWIWTAAVFLVALALYFIRTRLNKYKTAKLIRPGKNK